MRCSGCGINGAEKYVVPGGDFVWLCADCFSGGPDQFEEESGLFS